jgi:RNA polymerase sigma factor (sigma-70 family)
MADLGRIPLLLSANANPQRERLSLPTGGRISIQYIREIEHFPPMSREEEVVFARRMEFTAARLEAAEFDTPRMQAARRREYQQVRAAFIERSLHLVVSDAYSYRTYGVPLDDLIQEGNTALMRAVEKFDWRHAVRFRTYVSYWIRQAIERYLAAQKGAVRVPHHLQQKFRRLKREGRLPRHKDQELTMNQVAQAFEISPDLAGRLLQSSRPAFSLDQEVGPEGDTYRDFLLLHWEPSDQDRSQRLSHRLSDLLSSLDEREQTVLRMRFGLDGTESCTLEEVGRRLSLSRERSRQIQQKALRKLRRCADEHHLKDYL